MKKIFIALFSTLLLSVILPLGNSFKVEIDADSYYPMGCSVNEFEVSYIQDDGDLNKVSCHSSFADAKAKMKTSSDYVVRHANSYSPTKIIAMNSGVAYSYPARSGSITMNLYQNIVAKNNNTTKYKYTYITDYYEMTYYDTLVEYESSIKSNGKGFIKVSMNGFDGYVELEYTDLVPSKYIEKGIAIYVGGDHDGQCSYNKETPYYVVCHKNYYSIDKNGNYYDLVYHYYCDYIDGGNHQCYSNELHVDNAANYLNAGMKTGVKYYSNDGINFYSDSNCTKFVAQVYGYYQFLSLRSKTNISGSTFNSFLKSLGKNNSVILNKGQSFINAQNTYGSNALLIFSMACQESAYGESGYARNNHNLFGWGAYDSNPDNAHYFESVEQCINEHMGRNLNWYMDCTNWRYAGTCIGNKGTGINLVYCSDPYWGLKIASIAYRIDKYSNNNNGNLTDFNNYTVGVVDSNYNPSFGINTSNWNTPIYKNASGGDVLYYSKFNNNYQKDLTVVINEKVGNRYKVNISNPIINGSMYVDDGCVAYDWNKSIAYIDCNRVSITNGKKVTSVEKSTPTYKEFSSLRGITIENGILNVNGIGGIQGMDFTNNDANIKHEIIFYDANNSENKYEFIAENTAITGYNLNDGYDYKYVGYNLNLELNDENLPVGSYYLVLKTTNGSKTVESTIVSANSQYSNIIYYDTNNNYRITNNYIYNYRIEFDIFKTELNYSEISMPSSRKSLVSFDDISFDEEGYLNITGHGMIYYLNYDNPDNIAYTIYLVGEDGTTLQMNTELTENKFDYKTQLNSSYNLDHISFSGKIDLKGVTGTYNLILKIRNDSSIDYSEFVNMARMEMPSISNEILNDKILTSNVRNRLYLVAEEVETESIIEESGD